MPADFSQIRHLVADLSKMGADATSRAHLVVEKVAADIERDAKILAPVDTGNLRNSISRDVYGLRAEIGPTASYGGYVEEGTSRMSPQPYMNPALDRNTRVFNAAMRQIARGPQ